MKFIEIQRRNRNYKEGEIRKIIRRSFTSYKNKNKNKNTNTLIIYFGKDIIETLNWKAKDMVTISYAEEDNKIILLKKIKDTSIKNGYTLTSNYNSLRLQLHWKIYIPTEEERHITKVHYEKQKDNSLIIYLEAKNNFRGGICSDND